MALTEKLKAIADAVREVTGTTGLLTLDEMAEMITYLNAGTETYGANTYILVDQNGNEIPAVLTEEEVELTATVNDIRIGTTAVTDDGVVTGEKEIPAYYVYQGRRAIPKNGAFSIPVGNHERLQALLCKYNTNLDDSTYTDRVVINDSVYNVNSTTVVSTVTSNDSSTNLGMTNGSDSIYLIRYFMYKGVF